MSILKRHIASTVILATFVVLLMLTGVQLFISFVGQLDKINHGNYGVWQVMQYVGLMLPIRVYELFPMASLLGCLIGLGYLSSNNELVVMRASGMTLWQIIMSVFTGALILLIIMTFVGEVIGPAAVKKGEGIKKVAESAGQALQTEQGLWMRDAKDFIHIKAIMPGGGLQDISSYVFDSKNRLLKSSYAKRASYRDGKWWLYDILETSFSDGETNVKKIKSQVWPVRINLSLLRAVDINTNEVTLMELKKLVHYQQTNSLHITSYALQFWQRLFRPLATLVMVFLAIPFIFGPLRSVSMGLRIVFGTIAGFAFYLLNQFIGPFCEVYQILPLVGVILPLVLFLTIGCFFIYRIR